jgi:nicotinamide-nucleotide amidase
MNVEIIAIGDEVLLGSTENTNASFLSSALTQEGFFVRRHSVLPDEEAALLKGIYEAILCNDIVICTGGLGPTCDDITRYVAAKLYASDFYYDEDVAEHIRLRYGDTLISLHDQATLPSAARPILNDVGTAPGLIFRGGRTRGTLILLPGVPVEMKPMFTKKVLPFLAEHFHRKKRLYSRWIYFCQQSEPVIDKVLRKAQEKYPHVRMGIYPGLGVVAVRFMVKASSEHEAHVMTEGPYREMYDAFARYTFEASSGTLEEAVAACFTEKEVTLATAESCTGGRIAASLVERPGASSFFKGGIVAYSDAIKKKVLGVPEKVIEEYGAVSEEVVSLMVKGVIETMDSDYGIAVSGIAGPGGETEGKPVGTVCIGVGKKGATPHTWTIYKNGTREYVIKRTVNEVLGRLFMMISGRE